MNLILALQHQGVNSLVACCKNCQWYSRLSWQSLSRQATFGNQMRMISSHSSKVPQLLINGVCNSLSPLSDHRPGGMRWLDQFKSHGQMDGQIDVLMDGSMCRWTESPSSSHFDYLLNFHTKLNLKEGRDQVSVSGPQYARMQMSSHNQSAVTRGYP